MANDQAVRRGAGSVWTMRARLGLVAAAVLLVSSAPATAADTVLLRQSSQCLSDADVSLCLLKALAPHPFSRLVDDPELLAHPALLREAGVSIEAERSAIAEARLARGQEWVEALPDKFVVEAVLEAVLRAERGMSAEAILEPIRQQPLTRVKDWDQEGVAPSPRLLAYLDFWLIVNAGLGGASNPRLKEKLLEFWGEDLAAKEIGRAHSSDVGYVDMSTAEARVLTRLIPQGPPPDAASTRVTRLADQHKFDEALAALRGVSSRAERAALQAWDPERLAMATLMSGMVFGSVPDEEDNIAVLADRLLTIASLQLTVEAQKAGRDDVARAAADYLFTSAPYGAEPMIGLSAAVFKAASPAVAERWLDQASVKAPVAGWRSVDTILKGWRAIGQTDRAEALYRAALSVAEAQVANTAPFADRRLATTLGSYLVGEGRADDGRRLLGDNYEALIRADVEAGRTPGSLEGYLAEKADPLEQAKILKACADVTASRRAVTLARWCLERWPAEASLSTPRLHALRAAIGLAGDVAERDLPAARGLMRFALSELTAAAPSATGAWGPSTHALLAYAKAELRADGRLVPRPAEDAAGSP